MFLFLRAKDGSRGVTVAGIKDQEVLIEIFCSVLREFNFSAFDVAVFFKNQIVDCSKGGAILILFADGLLEDVNF